MPRRALYLIPVLVLLLVSGVVTLAHGGSRTKENGARGEFLAVINPGVQNRMDLMATAREATETLAGMMAGRVRFDRSQARAARRRLVAATKDIPSAFRRPHSDPLSRARSSIWRQWGDFRARARAAREAAQSVNADRLSALRSTLPGVIRACLECHRTYRREP